MALDLESIRSRLLLTKLGFLRSMLNHAGVGAEMMRVMMLNHSMSGECRELEGLEHRLQMNY